MASRRFIRSFLPVFAVFALIASLLPASPVAAQVEEVASGVSVDPVVYAQETRSPSELAEDLFGLNGYEPGPFAPPAQVFGRATDAQPSLFMPLAVDDGPIPPLEPFDVADHYVTPRETFPELGNRSLGFEMRSTQVGSGGGTVGLVSGVAELQIASGLVDWSSEMSLSVARPGLGSLGVAGTVFEVDLGLLNTRSTDLVTGDVVLTIDLEKVPGLKLFEYQMLQMVLYTGCDTQGCETAIELDSVLDFDARSLSVNISEDDAVLLSPVTGSNVLDSGDLDLGGITILALAAGANSGESSYSASKIAPLESYQVNGNTGALQVSYPIPAAPTSGLSGPGMGFSYSSAAVDGLNSSINTQPGEVGLGWSLTGQGSITRALETCSDAISPDDRCRVDNENTEAFSISFGQVSSKLVPDPNTTAGPGETWFRPENNPTWKVVRVEQNPFVAVDADSNYYGIGSVFVSATGAVQVYDTSFEGSSPVLGGATVVAIAAQQDGDGYWMLDSAGKVHEFGVTHYGDCTTVACGMIGVPIDLMVNPAGNGYFILTDTGHTYGFGTISAPGVSAALHTAINVVLSPTNRVVGGTFTADGAGIWIVLTDGQVYNTGTAGYAGGVSGNPDPVIGIARSKDANSYYIADVKGRLFKYGGTSNPVGNGIGMPDRDIVAIANVPRSANLSDNVHLLSAGANSIQLDGGTFQGRTSLGGSPDYLKTFWVAYGPDGSTHRFGFWRDNVSGYRNESVRAVPVYTSGAGCHNNLCNTAYQWDIDLSETVTGNITNFYYKNELNYYQDSASTQRVYARSSDLLHLVYARHSGITGGTPAGEWDWRATGRLYFTYEPRVDALGNYPDAPTATMDCGFGQTGGTCALSPGFYTKSMLSKVRNQLASADTTAVYTDISSVLLSHSFPAPVSEFDVRKLWLDSLDYRSGNGGTFEDGLIVFNSLFLKNRVNAGPVGDWMELPRINRITNQLKGWVDFTYGQPDGREPKKSGSNTQECWAGAGDPNGYIQLDCWFFPALQDGDWVLWNKYVIEKTVRSQEIQAVETNVGMPEFLTTDYEYGRIWWHRSDHDCTSCNSWNDYRGVEDVIIKPPDGTRVQNFYFNGMDGDNSTAHTRTSQFGTDLVDTDELRGTLFESVSYDSLNIRVSATRTPPVIMTTVAGMGAADGTFQIAPDWQEAWAYNASGVEVGKVATNIDYDNYGRPWRTMSYGDDSTSADDTVSETSYYTDLTNWILDRVGETRTRTGLVPGAGTVLSATKLGYGPNGVAPTYGYYSSDANGLVTPFSTADPVSPTGVKAFFSGSTWIETARAEYDQRGRPTRTTDAIGLVTDLTYDDDYGYLASEAVTIAAGDVLTTTYSTPPLPGIPHVITAPDDQVTTVTRDVRGRTTAVDYPGGVTNEVSYEYAIANSLNSVATTTKTAGSNVYTVQYGDGWGNPIQTQTTPQDSVGRLVSTTQYDSAGRPLVTGSPLDLSGAVGSGLVNHVWSTSDRYTTNVYLPRGMRTETQVGETSTVDSKVTSDGLAITYTDALGRTRLEVSNILGQLINVAEQCEGDPIDCSTGYATTAYTYEVTGQLDTITGPDSALTTLNYDRFGRKTYLSDPDSSIWTYTYDNVGNLLTQTATRHGGGGTPQITTMAVDNAGRVITVASMGDSQSFNYENNTGLLTSSTSTTNGESVTVANSYYSGTGVNAGRLNTTTWTIAGYTPASPLIATYTYEPRVGAIASITYPEPVATKETVTIGYNSLGQPKTLSSSATGDLVSAIDRDWLGRMTRMTRGAAPNQLYTDWEYSPGWQRLSQMLVGTLSGSVNLGEFLRTEYDYDKVGNITSTTDRTNSSQVTCYDYDAMNRLTSAFTTNESNSCSGQSDQGLYNFDSNWSYNGAGNITGAHGPGTVDENNTGPSTNYTYGAVQDHAVTDAGGRLFTYDFQGRQISRDVNGTQSTLSYNGLGQLESITTGSEVDSFLYDAGGTRVKRVLAADGSTTYYLGGLVEIEIPATPSQGALLGSPITGFAFNPRVLPQLLPMQVPPSFYSVLLVVGNTTLSVSDQDIYDRLVGAGHSVTLLDDGAATSSSGDGFDLVYISGRTASSLGSTFRYTSVPVISSQIWVSNSMSLGYSAGIGTYSDILKIVDSAHPVADGNSGSTAIYAGWKGHTYLTGFASGTVVATQWDDTTRHEIVAYETGDQLSNGFTAPARRLTWPWKSTTPQYVTAAGWSMFDEAVLWAAGDPSLDILLVSGSTAPPAGDVPVYDRLVAQGYRVTIVDDDLAVASDADGRDLVIIASSVVPATLAATFRDVTVPIVTWETWLHDDLGMISASGGGLQGSTSTNQTQLTITDPAHALAAGFASGVVTVSTGGTLFDFGKPAVGAEAIATVVGDATQVVIFGYETGVTMANAQAAPARRVGLWMSYNTPTTMTTDGWALFDAAVDWATATSTNSAPTVDAGTDQDLAFATTTAYLDATITDDGLPTPVSLTYAWTQVSGPNTATITTATAEDTTVTGLITGSYVFNLEANDSALTASDQVTVMVDDAIPGPYAVLFVVGNPTLSTADGLIKTRLEASGHTVTVIDDSATTTSSADGFDVVFISDGASSGTVGTNFKDTTTPVVSSDRTVSVNSMLGTGAAIGVYSNYVNVVDPSHPIADGNSGSTQVMTSIKSHTYLTAYPSGTIVATQYDDTNKHEIVAYETGDLLSTGFNAPGRRVVWNWRSTTAEYTIETGWSMFDEAIMWAAGGVSLNILMVSGSTAPPAGDVPVNDRLLAQGHTVTIVDDDLAVATDADGKDLVIIASSVVPTTLAATFKDVTVPIVTWESRLFDDMGLVATGDLGSTSTNQTQITITDPNHVLAAGFAAGAVTVSSGGTVFDYGKPVAAAIDIATVVGDSTQVVIFGYDIGVIMANAQAAPERRVGLWMSYSTPTTMTTDGWTLFDAAVSWATEIPTNIAPVVEAGTDQNLAFATTTASLDATVTDDGRPTPATLTYAWTQVSGPNTATITTPTAEDSGLTGLISGSYVFDLNVGDGDLATNDQIIVTVATNYAPVVNAGTDQTLVFATTTASLDATVTDDGLPAPPALIYAWTQVSGPNTAVITTPATEDTTVIGLITGVYVFDLSVGDGDLTANDQITVTVADDLPGPYSVLLVHGNSTLTTADTLIKNRLEVAGHTVTTLKDGLTDTLSAVGFDVVFITGTASSSWVGTSFNDTTVPVVSSSLWVTNAMQLGTGAGVGTYSNYVNVVDPAHQIADGNSGQTQIMTSIKGHYFVTAYVSGTVIATENGDSARHEIVAYEPGAKLSTGFYAPARRVVWPWRSTTADYIIETGWSMFDEAIMWAADPNTNPVNQPPEVLAGTDQLLAWGTTTASLDATVADRDALPDPSVLSYLWTQVSGPNTASITTPTAEDTGLTGLMSGVYVFDLAASDSDATDNDQITIEVISNVAPSVNTGVDQVLPNDAISATINATINDDNLPIPVSLTYSWTRITKPVGAPEPAITTATAEDTTVTGLVPGTYVFNLAVNDTELVGNGTISITVTPNEAPDVYAGVDQTLANGTTTAVLDATVSDPDGLPVPSTLTYTWTEESIPVTAATTTIASPNTEDTGISGLSIAGAYVYKLAVSDGDLTASSTVTIYVDPPASNTPPTATAPLDFTAETSENKILAGTVSDADGLPDPPGAVTALWTQISGPSGGTATFGNAALASTTVSFDTAGPYTLRLTANDSLLTAFDEVEVTVTQANETPDVIIRKHYSLAGVAVATRTITDYPTMTDTDELQWIVADHLGSTTNILSDTLQSKYQSWYYPYGELRGSVGAETGIDQTYTGQTNDPGTGLIHYNARQYDPVVARFIQQDSIVPNPTSTQDLNRYMYVRGNPMAYTDPSGHDYCPKEDIGCINADADNYPSPGSVAEALKLYTEDGGNPSDPAELYVEVSRLAELGIPTDMVFIPTDSLCGTWLSDGFAKSVCEKIPVTSCADVLYESSWGNAGWCGGSFVFVSQSANACRAGCNAIARAGSGIWSWGRLEVASELLDRLLASVPFPEELSGGESNVQVYFGIKDGEAIYAGITSSLSDRFRAHAPNFDELEPLTTDGLTRGQARAVEQALIVANPGFTNVINSISPTRSYYDQALFWGQIWLELNGY